MQSINSWVDHQLLGPLEKVAPLFSSISLESYGGGNLNSKCSIGECFVLVNFCRVNCWSMLRYVQYKLIMNNLSWSVCNVSRCPWVEHGFLSRGKYGGVSPSTITFQICKNKIELFSCQFRDTINPAELPRGRVVICIHYFHSIFTSSTPLVMLHVVYSVTQVFHAVCAGLYTYLLKCRNCSKCKRTLRSVNMSADSWSS